MLEELYCENCPSVRLPLTHNGTNCPNKCGGTLRVRTIRVDPEAHAAWRQGRYARPSRQSPEEAGPRSGTRRQAQPSFYNLGPRLRS